MFSSRAWLEPRLGAVALVFVAIVARPFDRSTDQQFPLDAAHESGQSVTAAYEGWFKNADGTFSLLVGYFNRNVKEALDIPIGPDNHLDPVESADPAVSPLTSCLAANGVCSSSPCPLISATRS